MLSGVTSCIAHNLCHAPSLTRSFLRMSSNMMPRTFQKLDITAATTLVPVLISVEGNIGAGKVKSRELTYLPIYSPFLI